MDDDVLQFSFGQVNARVDAKHEVVVFRLAVPIAPFLEATLPHKRLGIAQADRQHREFIAKHLAVELPKFFLYVWYGYLHSGHFLAQR